MKVKEYKFRIRIEKSAMGGDLYIPEFCIVYEKPSKWWQRICYYIALDNWQEVLKVGWDEPRRFGDLTIGGSRYCSFKEQAVDAINGFKARGCKNPLPRNKIINIE